ncbi:MAG: hypothetical protein Q4A32_03990 [Lachnospiraceae bacterium]|nr:hypothetical protein [Lachnospiraceae bacterium]
MSIGGRIALFVGGALFGSAAIAGELGLDDYIAEVLHEDKVASEFGA